MVALLLYSTISYTQDYDFNVNLIPETLKKDANSIVRLDNFFIEVESQDQMTIKVETAVTIYNKLADKYANIRIDYDKRRSYSNVKAYIYNATGKEIKKIKKSEFKDFSAQDGFSLFNDGRLIYYSYTPISYPYTIYYRYEIKTSNTAFIPDWILNGSYYQSIQNAKFEIKYPSGITLNKVEKNFEGSDVLKVEKPGVLSYEIKEILALKSEGYTPSLRKVLPTVQFGINKFSLEGVDGEATNWKDFGIWYYDNLLKNTQELDEGTKQKIRSLTAKVVDPVEKAKIVYEFVQNKVRYISVQVGIGGFKPMLAADVDRLGYGDCKALSNYTKALMDAAGVKSNYTIIYGGRTKRDISNEFLSVQGNHIILNLPTDNGDIWLECTSQKNPFGHLGSFTDDRDVLVVTPEGGKIKHTKIYKSEENYQFTKGSYSLKEGGSIEASLIIESSGTQYDDNLMRNDGESPKELDVLFKKYLSHINNIEFSNIEVLNNKKEGKFIEKLDFTATNYGSKTNSQLLVPINAFNMLNSVPKKIRNRKLPFVISRGYLDVDEVTIKLPNNLKLDYLPKSTELASKYGSYSLTIEKVDESNILFKRKLQIDAGNYPKEDYELYRAFLKKIKRYDNSKMILSI